MRNSFFPIAISLAVCGAAAAAPPQRVTIGYEIARNGLAVAEVQEHLEHDGRSYRLAETLSGKGIFALRGDSTRSSEGAVAADGLRPRKFEHKRSGRETLHAEFDPAAKTPTLQRQDALSFVWSFVFAPPKDTATVTVADGKHVTTYAYQVAGRERVKTPAGEFDALKLAKRRDKPEDKVTEIWLAADRHYLPVRILVIDKNGARLDQQAVRIDEQ